MSVQRKEYIIIGFKLDGEFTTRLWNRDDRDELDGKYEWDEDREDQIQYLTDGMSGEYTFFGFIKQISDGYDENTDAIEFKAATKVQKDRISVLFKELFPNERVPTVKMYYLPHYV